MKTSLKKLLKRLGEGKKGGPRGEIMQEVEAWEWSSHFNKRKFPVGMDYSLPGVTLGAVAKRPMAEHKQRLGLFARSWPEWITAETAIHMDIDWICLKEPNFFYVLTALYPHAKWWCGKK
jgi:hypothetical protein